MKETQRYVSNAEFFEWQAFEEWELTNQKTKLEHYLAAILAELRRSWADKPSTVKASDFYLTFGDSGVAPPPAVKEQEAIDAMSEEDYEKWKTAKMEMSKQAWGLQIGLIKPN